VLYEVVSVCLQGIVHTDTQQSCCCHHQTAYQTWTCEQYRRSLNTPQHSCKLLVLLWRCKLGIRKLACIALPWHMSAPKQRMERML
jgi:hypothetical protein